MTRKSRKKILVIKTLDPDPDWIRIRPASGSGSVFCLNAGSGSVLNEYGSETLVETLQNLPNYG
jgi:hypothetical protein